MKNHKFIFNFIIVLLLANCFFNFQINGTQKVFAINNLCEYKGTIENFFTHQIINKPELAFSQKYKYKYNFYKDCVTYKEFSNFLNQMYNNNFILVDIFDCYQVNNNQIIRKKLYLPQGKKPFILSFDDMSFDTKNKGMSDKLILTEDGKIASFTNSNSPQIEFDKESIPILENFIKEHPNFSFNNARGIICPTGYNGILGYRINKDNPNHIAEIEKVKPLVKKLKELNYHFACHSFGHIRISDCDCETVRRDTERYTNEILPVIGKTQLYCYPCGKYTTNKTKLSILKNAGYKIFLCVGLDKQENYDEDCLYLKRHCLDGGSMLKYRQQLLPIIDTQKIYDFEEREKTY